MTKNKKIRMIVEKTDTGFSAFSEEYSIYTTATTITDLLNHAFEASALYFEDQNITIDHNDIAFELDFQEFFKYYKILNSKILAQKIGMNESLLSQYVQGHKKPSKKQSNKILQGIHQIGQELSDLRLFQTN